MDREDIDLERFVRDHVRIRNAEGGLPPANGARRDGKAHFKRGRDVVGVGRRSA